MSANWPHQERGKQDLKLARIQGAKTILATGPCGSGKSRMMVQLAQEEVANGGTVKIYLHRSMLREQLSDVFNAQGIEHGVQVAGVEPDFTKPIQICMTDSVFSRAVNKGEWDIGTPSLVVFDEAHNQVEGKARAITFGGVSGNVELKGHYETGATILGFSATPVGCGLFYEKLVSFGGYQECRKVNAHLPVRVYSPSEIDCAGLAKNADGEFSPGKVQERATAIIGDAYSYWRKFNPDSRPALLFAPSLEGSKWFAEQWAKHGVPVAHLDGKECLLPVRTSTGAINLERYDTTPETRRQILQMSESGEIKVLMNRFVLREAIDMPWIYHGIGATVFGGIATYLQSVGRIQRFQAGYDFKIWQSHGGDYWRHGSPNMERHWKLGDTNVSIARERIEQIKSAEKPEEIEGICCPKCSVWRTRGIRCPGCGHSHKTSVRAIRQIDGTLKLQKGLVNRPKKKKNLTADSIWLSVLFTCGSNEQPISSAVKIWSARCKDAGIQGSITDLSHRPPDKTSSQWHLNVDKVFPWTNKKKKVKQ